VRKNISKYIAHSHNYQGHVIGLDFNFKNTPTRLIQIYNPTYEKKELRKEVLDYIISLTQNTKYKIIIMGDFNSVPNPRIDRLPPKKSSIPESQLIKYLISFQFKDIYRLFFPNIYNYTFHRSSIQSRIDQIWTNLSITNVDYTDIFLDHNTESDHHVLTLEISIIINKPQPIKQGKRKVFLWKNCSKENLENYANQTTNYLQHLTS
jgi:exonuclease III